ncbi:MAG: Dual-specificity RNA methyltransferase RlmN [Calditrichaeota bacterium]|nr:Dual-specificity RNA methyltransferase RlmN [Calditrichota bacterium]
MQVIARFGRDDLAVVYIAEDARGRRFEFVESLQPPRPRAEKWVNVISVLHGCPIRCTFCDAGGRYRGRISLETLLFQLDHLVERRWPDGAIDTAMWKVQFSRMGEPAFNPAVLDALELIPARYRCESFLPSISTIAPANAGGFFERLLEVKRRMYADRFQFQFSLHSTDEATRRELIPARTISFADMASYGERLHAGGGRKITLNFILAEGVPLDPNLLAAVFDPELFVVKLTPLNPTFNACRNGLRSSVASVADARPTAERFQQAGYDAIVSIGELEENAIGSNCGQYVSAAQAGMAPPSTSYSYAEEAVQRGVGENG